MAETVDHIEVQSTQEHSAPQKASTQKQEAHTGPHISIKPETIFHVNGFPVTNSLLLSAVVFVTFLIVCIGYFVQSKRSKKGSLFYVVTFVLKGLYELFYSVFGDKTEKFFTLLASLFLFILLQNWFGLLPGVGSVLIKVQEAGHEVMTPLLRANSADLNTTFALAIITMTLVQYYGVKYVGLIGYLKKFINFKGPLNFALGLLEVVSEFSRVISFAFRLFGNVFAGEVLLVVMAFLIPVLVSFPFLLLEIFVGFIQALVFAMLAAAFINTAIQKHH